MNLISLSFFAFLLILMIFYYSLPKKFQWIILLIASTFFYIYASVAQIAFLVFSIVNTFIFAKLIHKRKSKKLLSASIIINIGLLFILKYGPYTANLGSIICSKLKIPFSFPPLKFIIPLGLSFFTLQIVAYCVDVYKGKIEPETNILKYALFVSYFPQIIQGPIPRFDRLSPQFTKEHIFDYTKVKFGLQLMLFGYFKKLVIADRAAIFVNQIFNNYTKYEGLHFAIAAILYSLQLYCDFSGCVDICRGTSECFGISLDENFNRPYFATSIADFWRKWHISLSSWLRDYIYIPLGGNRKGIFRKYINVMIVFFTSGLWHGVGIHFIIWGLLHGIFQVIGAITKPIRMFGYRIIHLNPSGKTSVIVKRLSTFLLVSFAWIFFRANTYQAFYMVKSIFARPSITRFTSCSMFTATFGKKEFILLLFGLLILYLISRQQEKLHIREWISHRKLPIRWTIYITAIIAVVVFGIYGPGFSNAEFIYMQF